MRTVLILQYKINFTNLTNFNIDTDSWTVDLAGVDTLHE